MRLADMPVRRHHEIPCVGGGSDRGFSRLPILLVVVDGQAIRLNRSNDKCHDVQLREENRLSGLFLLIALMWCQRTACSRLMSSLGRS